MNKSYTAHRFENAYGYVEIREQPNGQFTGHWEAWDNHKKGGMEEVNVDLSDYEGNIYIDQAARLASAAQEDSDFIHQCILLETAKRNFLHMAQETMEQPSWQAFVGYLRQQTREGWRQKP